MDLSLSKLPWHAQIGAFVLVSGGAVFAFWMLYATEMEADIRMRQSRLVTVRADVAKGLATARRVNEFRAQVNDLEARHESLKAVLPEQKDVAEILRRVQGLATQSNLTIQRFTPQPPKGQTLYAELPYKLQAEGTYHNLGAFFDKISKFHRIINVSEISIRAKPQQSPTASIVAECIATTFVLQEGKPAGAPVAAR